MTFWQELGKWIGRGFQWLINNPDKVKKAIDTAGDLIQIGKRSQSPKEVLEAYLSHLRTYQNQHRPTNAPYRAQSQPHVFGYPMGHLPNSAYRYRPY